MASPQPASSSSPPSSSENPKGDLLKKIRSHEVAISELNNLPPSRAAYQRNCNIFFCRNIKTAIAFEQSMHSRSPMPSYFKLYVLFLIMLSNVGQNNLTPRNCNYKSLMQIDNPLHPMQHVEKCS